jgi:NAD(P)H-quinone oxidoreductase subunit 6
MAMVGAIILARRDLIPELTTREPVATSLTLPERPRELATLAGDGDKQD